MRQTIDTWVGFVQSAVNKIGSLFSQASSNDEKRLSKEYKKRREYIEANIKDEKERKAQLAALDEEEDAKKLAIQQKQAKRDKALGIFNTIIDTAAAIVRTLRDMGPGAQKIKKIMDAGCGKKLYLYRCCNRRCICALQGYKSATACG
jgi:hypothetical protein